VLQCVLHRVTKDVFLGFSGFEYFIMFEGLNEEDGPRSR
jgi:hypothetical protein